MMEELVMQLAELQESRKAAETVADNASSHIDGEITVMQLKVAELIEDRRTLRLPYDISIAHIDGGIEDLSAQILDEWDGEKKTLQYPAGTLKFRTTKRLEINDGAALLASLIGHFSINAIAEKYISGFNKTAVKKFIDLHPPPPDVTELIENTTVKLDESKRA